MGIKKRKQMRPKARIKPKPARKRPRIDRNQLPNPEAAKLWKEDATLQDNYKALGLQLNPNDGLIKRGRINQESVDADDVASGATEEPIIGNPPPEAPRTRTLTFNEANNCRAFIEAHGDDIEAMARDRKLNKYQLTAAQIQKKLRVYKRDYLDEEKQSILKERREPPKVKGLPPKRAKKSSGKYWELDNSPV